ncbi:MAG: tetratricopeptide repeat protein [Woeseiaceae bacterium]|nr:tetratricopeptide repeat protein [Woeseiaceae bacterium]
MTDTPMTEEPLTNPDPRERSSRRKRLEWRRKAIGLGAVAALASAALAVLANLSEIAGWFAPDETQELVKETRVAIEDTDAKINELLNLLRNQAAAAGVDLNIESEVAIRNAIQTIIASADAQKQAAFALLDDGKVAEAAGMLTRIAATQDTAVSETSGAAAATWREAGALYFSENLEQAIHSYRQADRLQPGNPETLDMLGHSLVRAGKLDEARAVFTNCLELHPPPALSASALHGLGNIARQAGDYKTADENYRHALQISVDSGLRTEQARLLIAQGMLARAEGKLDLAESRLKQAEGLAEDTDNNTLQAKIQTSLGIIAASSGRYDEANQHIREALEIYRARNNLAGQANTIGNLGAVALLQEDLESAETFLLESVDIGERLGWKESVAYDLVNLGGQFAD